MSLEERITELEKIQNDWIASLLKEQEKRDKEIAELIGNTYKGMSELDKQIDELKESVKALGGFSNEHAYEIVNLEEVLRELGNHYKENLIYMAEHTELWDWDVEALKKILAKLDGPRDHTEDWNTAEHMKADLKEVAKNHGDIFPELKKMVEEMEDVKWKELKEKRWKEHKETEKKEGPFELTEVKLPKRLRESDLKDSGGVYTVESEGDKDGWDIDDYTLDSKPPEPKSTLGDPRPYEPSTTLAPANWQGNWNEDRLPGGTGVVVKREDLQWLYGLTYSLERWTLTQKQMENLTRIKEEYGID